MEKGDRELLLKDLCGRLPYGVKVMKQFKSQTRTLMSIDVVNLRVYFLENDVNSPFGFDIEDQSNLSQQIKPYLRPMSSMTEEEKEEYKRLCIKETLTFATFQKVKWHDTWKSIDWLNAHHFDYRGLIEKGLAIAVTKENNPYEK